jgi:CoA-dependent NAD(P)H sulfur oxidoreductase
MIKQQRIIVIGGNAAGPAAAAKAKRINPNANVKIFEAGNFISTGVCEIPYVLSGDIKNYEDIIYYSAESFLKDKGVNVYLNHLVEKINRRDKLILVKNLSTDKTIEYPYDSLILTTGSYSKSVPGFPTGLKNIFYLKSINDFLRLKEYLHENTVKSSVILGAGYIGIEAAEALIRNGIEVAIIEKEKLPLPNAEEEIGKRILTTLNNNSVRFIGSSKNLEPFIKNDSVVTVNCEGEFIQSEIVILAVGILPNVHLAELAGLDIGRSGGIKVGRKLRTSDRNIFAAGDNIEFINAITGKSDYFPFATYAHTFGHIAGENAAGGNVSADPVVKNVSIKVFDKYYSSVGLNSKEAMAHNLKFNRITTEVSNLVKVMPGSDKVYGELIYNSENKKILGASFYGGREVSGYSDLVASLIYSGQTVEFLSKISYNYTPPLSPFINLLSILGRKAKK